MRSSYQLQAITYKLAMVLIDSNSTVLQLGAGLPHFSLPATDGSTIDTTQIDSSVLVVVFTCNHCPYAQAVESRLIELGKEFQGKDVSFVLICSNDAADYPDDSFDAMKERAKEKGYPFPYCHDELQEVAKSFGALCTPHCFVFDQKRNLRYKGRIDDNWKEPEKVTQQNLRDAIVALLENKDPPVMEMNAIGCSIKWK
jgi:peroxiredoxin